MFPCQKVAHNVVKSMELVIFKFDTFLVNISGWWGLNCSYVHGKECVKDYFYKGHD